MWQRRAELNLLLPVLMTFRHSHPAMAKMEQPQIAAVAEMYRPRVLDFLTLLDSEVAQRPFLAGDQFSIADITALVAVDFLKPARIEMPDLVDLKRWHKAVSSRPSAVP